MKVKIIEYRCRECKDRFPISKIAQHYPVCLHSHKKTKFGMSEDSEVTESVSEGPNPRRNRRRRPRRQTSRERPSTATLDHPNVLDETLKDKLDMTLTKKNLLAAVKLCNDQSSFSKTTTASNLAMLRKLRKYQYSSNDETGSSSGSAEQIYQPPKGRSRTRQKQNIDRPVTSTLEKPSHSDLDIPNIRYHSKPRNPKARLNHRLKTEARRKMFTREESIQEPCFSCGRSDQPERFHTHPGIPPGTHPGKLIKSPLKEAKLINNNNTELSSSEKRGERKDGRVTRSLSPRKSVSPDKTSESSPQSKRRNGKENSETSEKSDSEKGRKKKTSDEGYSSPTKSPLKGRLVRPRGDQAQKPAKKDFTVDIFTVKKEVEEDQTKSKQENHDEESSEDKSEKLKPTPPTPSHGVRPTAVKCKICGKEFGKASIKFHEPQCERKKLGEDERKEKERLLEEQMEKNNVSYMDHLEEVDLNDSFDAIWQAHMQQLQPCGTCGRTFFPERLVIHERSCKSKTPKTADPQMNRRPRLGPISPKAEKPVPENPVRDIPVQYYLAK